MSLKNFKLITENWTNFLKEEEKKSAEPVRVFDKDNFKQAFPDDEGKERYQFDLGDFNGDSLDLNVLVAGNEAIDFEFDIFIGKETAEKMLKTEEWQQEKAKGNDFLYLESHMDSSVEEAKNMMLQSLKTSHGEQRPDKLIAAIENKLSKLNLSDDNVINTIPTDKQLPKLKSALIRQQQSQKTGDKTTETPKTPVQPSEPKTPVTPATPKTDSETPAKVGEPEKVETTTKGQEAIAKIQEILVAAGFAPKVQASGKNQGKHFADGRFGRLTYAALLKAHRDSTAK